MRRKAEVAEADALLHVISEVLDIHDGELLPTLENRRTITRLIRDQLAQWYGAETAAKIEFVEAFEVCEYGRQPNKEELRQLFPFLPAPQAARSLSAP